MEYPQCNLTLGRILEDNRKKLMAEREKRIDEIENWMIDNPYTHPEFQKYVEERNHLTTQLKLV